MTVIDLVGQSANLLDPVEDILIDFIFLSSRLGFVFLLLVFLRWDRDLRRYGQEQLCNGARD